MSGGVYDAKAEEWATNLRALTGWFIDNYPQKLAELYGEPFTHVKPPSYREADFYNWAWWHPESAKLWIAKLQLQKTYLEGSNERTRNTNIPNDASLRPGDDGWSGADGATPFRSDTMSEVEEFNRIMEDIEQGTFDVETVDAAFEADIAKLEDALAWQAEYEAKKAAAQLLPFKAVLGIGKARLMVYVLAFDIEQAKEMTLDKGRRMFPRELEVVQVVACDETDAGVFAHSIFN